MRFLGDAWGRLGRSQRRLGGVLEAMLSQDKPRSDQEAKKSDKKYQKPYKTLGFLDFLVNGGACSGALKRALTRCGARPGGPVYRIFLMTLRIS